MSKEREESSGKSAMSGSSSSRSVLLGLVVVAILADSVVASVEIVDSKNAEEHTGFATVVSYERQPKIFGLGISDRTTTVSV